MKVKKSLILKFVYIDTLEVRTNTYTTSTNYTTTTTFLNNLYGIVNKNLTFTTINYLQVEIKTDGTKTYKMFVDGKQITFYGYIFKNDKVLYLREVDNLEGKDTLIDNAEICFPTYVENNNTINTCYYGKMYTDEYAQNRLIVCGNSSYTNCDWWTENIDTSSHSDDYNLDNNAKYNDFTYFPDTNYCYYGDNGNLCGYEVESTGKLVVFNNNNQNNIYFRNGTQQYVGQNTTTNTYDYTYKLNMSGGNTGSYPLNVNCITSFNGTIVYLSNNKQLEGLIISETLRDSTRYAYSRSNYINAKLKDVDLATLTERSFVKTHGNWLYVCVGKTIYATRYDEFDSETNQYEWYVIGSSILDEDEYFSDILGSGDNIYLSTTKGYVFKWENEVENVYEDIKKITFDETDINSNGAISNNLLSKVKVGDLVESNMLIELENISYVDYQTKDCKINIGNIEKNKISKQIYDYFSTNPTGYNGNRNYKILFKQYDEYLEDNSVMIETISFTKENNDTILHLILDNYSQHQDAISGKLLFKNTLFKTLVKEIKTEEEKNYIYLEVVDNENGNDKVNCFLNTTGITTPSGTIKVVENVKAVFVSAPLAMGTLTSYKNIYSYTITNDTKKASELYSAIISNSIPIQDAKEIGAISNDKFGFSLDNIDFSQLAFAQDYVAARAYTKYRNLIRQRFTDFVFYNKNNTNAVLSNMSLVYTITTPVIGGE